MDIEIVQLGDLGVWDFKKVARLDAEAWQKVLFAEHETDSPYRIHMEEYERLRERCKRFPEGQIVAYCHDPRFNEPVGVINSLRINVPDIDAVPRTWHDLTGKGYFTTHKEDGNLQACVSIVAMPLDDVPPELREEYKKQQVSRKLINAQLKLANDSDMDYMIAYSRPANYAKNKAKYPSMNEYLEAVKRGDVNDPIGMHLHFGAAIWKVLPNGRKDEDAGHYNVIMRYPLVKDAPKPESTQEAVLTRT